MQNITLFDPDEAKTYQADFLIQLANNVLVSNLHVCILHLAERNFITCFSEVAIDVRVMITISNKMQISPFHSETLFFKTF